MPVLTGQDTQAIGSALASLFGNPADEAKAAAILANTARDQQQVQGRQALSGLLNNSVTMGPNGLPSFAPGAAGRLAGGAALADGTSGLAAMIAAMSGIPHTAAQIASANASAGHANALTKQANQTTQFNADAEARANEARALLHAGIGQGADGQFAVHDPNVVAAAIASGLGPALAQTITGLNPTKAALSPDQLRAKYIEQEVAAGRLPKEAVITGALDPIKLDQGQAVVRPDPSVFSGATGFQSPAAPPASSVAGVFQPTPQQAAPAGMAARPAAPTIGPAGPMPQGAPSQAGSLIVNGNSITNPKPQTAPEKVLDQIQRSLGALNQSGLALRALGARPGAVGGAFNYFAPGMATWWANRNDGEVISALQNASAAKTHELYGGSYTEPEAKRSVGFLPNIGYNAEKNTDRLRFMYNESAQKLEQALSMLPAGYQVPSELRAQIEQFRSFPESKLLGAFSGMAAGQQMPVLPTPTKKNQVLGASDAQVFIQAAGGDNQKAREMATKQGFRLK